MDCACGMPGCRLSATQVVALPYKQKVAARFQVTAPACDAHAAERLAVPEVKHLNDLIGEKKRLFAAFAEAGRSFPDDQAARLNAICDEIVMLEGSLILPGQVMADIAEFERVNGPVAFMG